VPQIRAQLHLSTSFQIHHSHIALPFDAVLFEILTVPLNHTETNYGDVTIAKEWI
jgi:hypothetical protein